jgi:hypothetical protein
MIEAHLFLQIEVEGEIEEGKYHGGIVYMTRPFKLPCSPVVGAYLMIDGLDDDRFEESMGDWKYDGIEIQEIRYHEFGVVHLENRLAETPVSYAAEFFTDLISLGFQFHDVLNSAMATKELVEELMNAQEA